MTGKTSLTFHTEGGMESYGALAFQCSGEHQNTIAYEYLLRFEPDDTGTMRIFNAERLLPADDRHIGQVVTCSQCGTKGVPIVDIVVGGDKESYPVWFLTLHCPTCGLVEEME